MGTALEILIILLLVLLNGAFAMSELAIVSSRRSRLMAMQKRGVRGADTALALVEREQVLQFPAQLHWVLHASLPLITHLFQEVILLLVELLVCQIQHSGLKRRVRVY